MVVANLTGRWPLIELHCLTIGTKSMSSSLLLLLNLFIW